MHGLAARDDGALGATSDAAMEHAVIAGCSTRMANRNTTRRTGERLGARVRIYQVMVPGNSCIIKGIPYTLPLGRGKYGR